MSSALESNVLAYGNHLNDLLATDAGRFVVIEGGNLVKVCDTYEEALTLGYTSFRRSPFFVRQIVPLSEETIDFHAACRL